MTGTRIRRTAGAAVLLLGGADRRYHLVADNYVREYGTDSGSPGIDVQGAGITVRESHLLAGEGRAIVEREAAGANRYRDNWAEGASPWAITSPSSLVRDNVPSIDVHRDLTADESGTVAVDFEKPYARAPRLTFGRRGGVVEEIAYETDGSDNVTGVTVTVAQRDAPLDVFVDAVSN